MKQKNKSTSHNQLCSFIHCLLVDIFRKEGLNIFEGSLVTITDVELTPDKRQCRIYCSILNTSLSSKFLEEVELKRTKIQRSLSSGLKKRMKYVPVKWHFYTDATAENASRVIQLIEKISDFHKPNNPEL